MMKRREVWPLWPKIGEVRRELTNTGVLYVWGTELPGAGGHMGERVYFAREFSRLELDSVVYGLEPVTYSWREAKEQIQLTVGKKYPHLLKER